MHLGLGSVQAAQGGRRLFSGSCRSHPHRSRVPRVRPSRGSHTVTCPTPTGTLCRVNTARRRRPGAPGAAEPAPMPAAAPAGHPPAPGRSEPHEATPGAAGLPGVSPPGTGGPRERRPPRPPAPPVTPWTLHRQALRGSGSGAFPFPICCEANHCIALSCRRQPKRGREKKKSFQLMISLGTGEGGGGGGQ